MICVQCNKKINDNAKFCNFCGAKQISKEPIENETEIPINKKDIKDINTDLNKIKNQESSAIKTDKVLLIVDYSLILISYIIYFLTKDEIYIGISLLFMLILITIIFSIVSLIKSIIHRSKGYDYNKTVVGIVLFTTAIGLAIQLMVYIFI